MGGMLFLAFYKEIGFIKGDYFSIYTSHKMAPREHIEYVETLAHNPVSVQL